VIAADGGMTAHTGQPNFLAAAGAWDDGMPLAGAATAGRNRSD
jgi:hypothetical protein